MRALRRCRAHDGQGNIVLTDHAYTILSLLRPRVDNEDVRFAVRERYPVENAHQRLPVLADESALCACRRQ